MDKRRPFIYVLIVVVIGLLYFKFGSAQSQERVTIPLPPDPITLEQIFTDFHDLKDNQLPVSPVLGGSFFTTALRVTSGFKGVEGDTFYAAIEDGHVAYILQYSLKELYDRKLVYQVSKVIEGTTWPPGQGVTYMRDDQGFKKQP